MLWSPQQDSAMRAVNDWLSNSTQQLFKLFGVAGSGKSTLAIHLAQHVKGHVLFGAYTGKAARVMQRKGCIGATTLHSLVYLPKAQSRARVEKLQQQILDLEKKLAPFQDSEDPSAMPIAAPVSKELAELHRQLKEAKRLAAQPAFSLNPDSPLKSAKLLVLDECSMVDKMMAEDILSFGCKVLVLGDPCQLPPIGGGGAFNKDPDVFLDEIHRQAADSPILRLATMARRGETIQIGDYGPGVRVVRSPIDPQAALTADQLIAGRNKTRHASNARFRQLLGFENPMPVSGDKLVCLRNDHDLGLLNGTLWRVGQSIADLDAMRVDLSVSSLDEPGPEMAVECHAHHFLGREDELEWYERREAQEMTYGYCLTAHKAQGSEWDSVVVIDESQAFGVNAAKWIYTAITRSSKQLTIVK